MWLIYVHIVLDHGSSILTSKISLKKSIFEAYKQGLFLFKNRYYNLSLFSFACKSLLYDFLLLLSQVAWVSKLFLLKQNPRE